MESNTLGYVLKAIVGNHTQYLKCKDEWTDKNSKAKIFHSFVEAQSMMRKITNYESDNLIHRLKLLSIDVDPDIELEIVKVCLNEVVDKCQMT